MGRSEPIAMSMTEGVHNMAASTSGFNKDQVLRNDDATLKYSEGIHAYGILMNSSSTSRIPANNSVAFGVSSAVNTGLDQALGSQLSSLEDLLQTKQGTQQMIDREMPIQAVQESPSLLGPGMPPIQAPSIQPMKFDLRKAVPPVAGNQSVATHDALQTQQSPNNTTNQMSIPHFPVSEHNISSQQVYHPEGTNFTVGKHSVEMQDDSSGRAVKLIPQDDRALPLLSQHQNDNNQIHIALRGNSKELEVLCWNVNNPHAKSTKIRIDLEKEAHRVQNDQNPPKSSEKTSRNEAPSFDKSFGDRFVELDGNLDPERKAKLKQVCDFLQSKGWRRKKL